VLIKFCVINYTHGLVLLN